MSVPLVGQGESGKYALKVKKHFFPPFFRLYIKP